MEATSFNPTQLYLLQIFSYNQDENSLKDDNKFVDCAVSANASCIVTNDRHFNVLRNIEFPKINPIDIHTFKSKVLML